MSVPPPNHHWLGMPFHSSVSKYLQGRQTTSLNSGYKKTHELRQLHSYCHDDYLAMEGASVRARLPQSWSDIILVEGRSPTQRLRFEYTITMLLLNY